MYHFAAGVTSMAAFGAAAALPSDGTLWVAARLLFDGAGALFGLYLLIGLGLVLVGAAMRSRHGGEGTDASPRS